MIDPSQATEYDSYSKLSKLDKYYLAKKMYLLSR